eukprot:CAMPEP_0204916508 /NCGR_PEP_ID=MMETSP1397-20131031/14298_1 /ASSEMBLY_ACC=CAM_ASM_000891 /TAXON_ID=49980 /ORGANISM="Climacostomum Climacostomum virens, Strain Stock W-24" /LENGTH=119 /DNA_ID=CAMNT_0052089021 /DNA_START=1 /DNA_END=357 /DNA_ORIENTATION=-
MQEFSELIAQAGGYEFQTFSMLLEISRLQRERLANLREKLTEANSKFDVIINEEAKKLNSSRRPPEANDTTLEQRLESAKSKRSSLETQIRKIQHDYQQQMAAMKKLAAEQKVAIMRSV